MKRGNYLVQQGTGEIYNYHPGLAKRADMILRSSLESAKAQSALEKAPEAESPEDDGQEADFVLSRADKKELEAFAKAEFNVDLDRRKKIDDLRQEVAQLAAEHGFELG